MMMLTAAAAVGGTFTAGWLGGWAVQIVPGVVVKATVLLGAAWGVTTVLWRVAAAVRHVVWVGAMAGLVMLPLAMAVGPRWRVMPAWMGGTVKDARPAAIGPIARARGSSEGIKPAAAAGDGGARRMGDAGLGAGSQVGPPPSSASRASLESGKAEEGVGTTAGVGTTTGIGTTAGVGSTAGTDSTSGTAVGIGTTAAIDKTAGAGKVAGTGATAGEAGMDAGMRWLGLMWLAGVVVMLGRMGWGLRMLERQRRAAGVAEGAWAGLMDDCCVACGVRRRVELRLSADAGMPLTFGVIRPWVMLPASAAGWSVEKRRLVLLHELSHAARGDILAQGVAAAARAMYWFHPLMWLAWRRIEIERERACDDHVLRLGEGAAGGAGSEAGMAAAYAETLVEIATAYVGRNAMVVTGLAMARQSTLETRVRRVLDVGCRRGGVSRRMALTLGGMVVGLAALVGMLQGAEGGGVGGGVMAVVPSGGSSGSPVAGAPAAGTPAANAPANSKDRWVKKLASGGTIELVAVSNDRMSPLWTPEGGPFVTGTNVDPLPHYQRGPDIYGGQWKALLFRSAGGIDEANIMRVTDDGPEPLTPLMQPGTGKPAYVGMAELFPAYMPVGTIRVGVSNGPWKILAEDGLGHSGKQKGIEYSIGQGEQPKEPAMLFGGGGRGGAQDPPTPPGTADGVESRLRERREAAGAAAERGSPRPGANVRVAYTTERSDVHFRVVAVGADGKEQEPTGSYRIGRAGNLYDEEYVFNMKLEQIKSVRFEARAIEWVEFSGFALEPGGGKKDPRQGGVAGVVLLDPASAKVEDAAAPAVADGAAVKPAEELPGEYYVMGVVERPGVYSLTGRKINILQAMAAANLADPMRSDPNLVITILRRLDDTHEKRIAVLFSDIMSDRTKDMYLQPNDVLIVDFDPTKMTKEALQAQIAGMQSKQAQLQREIDASNLGPRHPENMSRKQKIDTLEDYIKKEEEMLKSGNDAAKPVGDMKTLSPDLQARINALIADRAKRQFQLKHNVNGPNHPTVQAMRQMIEQETQQIEEMQQNAK